MMLRMAALMIPILAACRPQADIAKEREIILELHHAQRDVHVQKNVDGFVDMLASHHISVNRGRVDYPTPEENRERFRNYFNRVEFIKWDDIEEPEIFLSDDATMAYTVVQKEVIVRRMETAQLDTSRFSWVAIYRKHGEQWKIDCVASTNR